MGSHVLTLALLSVLTSSLGASGDDFLPGEEVTSSGGSGCPAQCVCETRPWYTPQSVYHQARTVDCNELRLHHVPPTISPNTQVLLLQSNNISLIGTELQNLNNLTELDLSQNHFRQVQDMGLGSLEQLVTLYLEENLLEGLEDFSLRTLSSLEELYVNHNRLNSISQHAFSGLTSLLRLHLNSNRLVAIDRRWFESLPSLEILMIGENPILGLEERTFQPLARLHSLVLAGMGLEEVPPAAFLGLHYLESLSFYDNKLRWVPREALSMLQNLKFLDLNRNPISRVGPGDFQDLLHLEELSLNYMDQLVAVERDAFQNLPEMVKLEVYSNPGLVSVDPHAFSGLPSLRTLLLHSNQLSLLSNQLLTSLPGLEELSLHSNPLRCDCLAAWGPHLGNQSAVKLLDSPLTTCSSPPQLLGRELQEVVSIGWGAVGGGASGNSCLPQVSALSFPPVLNLSSGQPITLPCWASADPAPQFYWVTPTGDKVSSEAGASLQSSGPIRRRRHRVSPSGALVMEHLDQSDAGLYTCVAWNVEGADTRSVSVFVDSRGRGSGPGGEESWGGNSSHSAASLVLQAKVVRSHSVLLEWKLFSSQPAAGSGGSAHQEVLPRPPRWTSASVHIDSSQISYTATVPVDVQEYNLTHLLPATDYHVCLSVSSSAPLLPPPSPSPPAPPSPSAPPPPLHTACVNVTTREAGLAVALVVSSGNSVAMAAVTGSLFALLLMLLLGGVMARRLHSKSCSLKTYLHSSSSSSSIPLKELYPPLITLWDADADKEKEREEEQGGAPIDTSKTYLW
ncbi:leucine-rich repeat neuronal protein 1 isoform X1 [Gadus morhua]|uniref:leucine-rich repeat neuronal protein 1 isoform X1 n=1 Tax=Gadus morhua TaxID=8049 RepID=UPI0011B75ED5|nr:leucine-rich repeat neuronal protein 1-like isoform X1 [Gadus morhua]XP_030222147.1 leucine-rich repeat neuronal protein 1-like isoform X1 [Gadus morhua]